VIRAVYFVISARPRMPVSAASRPTDFSGQDTREHHGEEGGEGIAREDPPHQPVGDPDDAEAAEEWNQLQDRLLGQRPAGGVDGGDEPRDEPVEEWWVVHREAVGCEGKRVVVDDVADVFDVELRVVAEVGRQTDELGAEEEDPECREGREGHLGKPPEGRFWEKMAPRDEDQAGGGEQGQEQRGPFQQGLHRGRALERFGKWTRVVGAQGRFGCAVIQCDLPALVGGDFEPGSPETEMEERWTRGVSDVCANCILARAEPRGDGDAAGPLEAGAIAAREGEGSTVQGDLDFSEGLHREGCRGRDAFDPELAREGRPRRGIPDAEDRLEGDWTLVGDPEGVRIAVEEGNVGGSEDRCAERRGGEEERDDGAGNLESRHEAAPSGAAGGSIRKTAVRRSAPLAPCPPNASVLPSITVEMLANRTAPTSNCRWCDGEASHRGGRISRGGEFPATAKVRERHR
jgi:hypothetical protein